MYVSATSRLPKGKKKQQHWKHTTASPGFNDPPCSVAPWDVVFGSLLMPNCPALLISRPPHPCPNAEGRRKSEKETSGLPRSGEGPTGASTEDSTEKPPKRATVSDHIDVGKLLTRDEATTSNIGEHDVERVSFRQKLPCLHHRIDLHCGWTGNGPLQKPNTRWRHTRSQTTRPVVIRMLQRGWRAPRVFLEMLQLLDLDVGCRKTELCNQLFYGLFVGGSWLRMKHAHVTNARPTT